ncbi:hypothetical protein DSLASN_45770 [Desulfoluna limicola]|uniref:Uncharacterized protein n=1 Tax=Desulfoluna limicola TaxID=2810562 RepID=A0ABN6FDL3_9BACT|nr:hypothetical protein DSLASN_45770 [Desulfoluna limicola]
MGSGGAGQAPMEPIYPQAGQGHGLAKLQGSGVELLSYAYCLFKQARFYSRAVGNDAAGICIGHGDQTVSCERVPKLDQGKHTFNGAALIFAYRGKVVRAVAVCLFYDPSPTVEMTMGGTRMGSDISVP